LLNIKSLSISSEEMYFVIMICTSTIVIERVSINSSTNFALAAEFAIILREREREREMRNGQEKGLAKEKLIFAVIFLTYM
jgi:hypothetical protein